MKSPDNLRKPLKPHGNPLIFILIGIFVLAFFLRAQETLFNNYLFLKDQGRDMMAVKSIVVDHKLTLIGPYSSLQSVFQGPLYYYLLAIPFFLTNGNPIGGMWLMLLLSMFSVGIAYWWVRKLFGETAALFTAFIFAVSPGASAAATFIWNPHPTLPIVTLWLYFLLQVTSKKSSKFLYGIAATIGLLFHFQIALGVGLGVISAIYLVVYRRDLFTSNVKNLLIAAGIFLLLLSPLIVFDLRHDDLTSKSILRMLLGETQGLGDSREPYGKILVDHYNSMLNTWRYSYTWISPFQLPLILVTILTSLYISLKNKQFRKIFLLPFLVYIVYMLYPYQLWGWFIMGTYPIFILILGLVLWELSKYSWGKGVAGIIVAILLFGSAQELNKNYSRAWDEGGAAKINGKLAAIDTIYKDANGQPFNVLVFAPVVLTDDYDYLLWWYGSRKYGYAVGREKLGTFYLLMEPDSKKPWSYKGWQETVVKTGEVIWTKELPSGLVVEKRVEQVIPAVEPESTK